MGKDSKYRILDWKFFCFWKATQFWISLFFCLQHISEKLLRVNKTLQRHNSLETSVTSYSHMMRLQRKHSDVRLCRKLSTDVQETRTREKKSDAKMQLKVFSHPFDPLIKASYCFNVKCFHVHLKLSRGDLSLMTQKHKKSELVECFFFSHNYILGQRTWPRSLKLWRKVNKEHVRETNTVITESSNGCDHLLAAGSALWVILSIWSNRWKHKHQIKIPLFFSSSRSQLSWRLWVTSQTHALQE